MTFIIVAIVLIVVLVSVGSSKKKTTDTIQGLNENGLKFVQDIQNKINNGDSLLLNSVYLKNFNIHLDEKFSLNQLYEEIFDTKNEKTQDFILNQIMILMDRNSAENDVFECEVENSANGVNLFNDELMIKNWNVTWKERKTTTTGITYGGIRMKGKGSISGVFGHMNLIKHTKTEFQTLDEGNLYLTSKRLIFVGYNQKNKTIRLDRILNLEVFKDGFYVNKENGDSPMIVPTTPSWYDSVSMSKYISRVLFEDVQMVVK